MELLGFKSFPIIFFKPIARGQGSQLPLACLSRALSLTASSSADGSASFWTPCWESKPSQNNAGVVPFYMVLSQWRTRRPHLKWYVEASLWENADQWWVGMRFLMLRQPVSIGVWTSATSGVPANSVFTKLAARFDTTSFWITHIHRRSSDLRNGKTMKFMVSYNEVVVIHPIFFLDSTRLLIVGILDWLLSTHKSISRSAVHWQFPCKQHIRTWIVLP